MQEMVAEILKVEEKSAALVDEARRQAAEEKEAVDLEIAVAIKRARDEAQATIRSRAEAALAESKRDHDAAIAKAASDQATFATTHAASIEALVEKIVSLIVTPANGTRRT